MPNRTHFSSLCLHAGRSNLEYSASPLDAGVEDDVWSLDRGRLASQDMA